MKQLIQSYKTGELGLFDVPAPYCNENGILINTTASLVSAGTEKMIVDIAKKSLLGKARSRPDLVRKVIDKMQKEGIKNTLEKVFTKLDTPIPLGYSCAGRVTELGRNITGISIGDRVAGGGSGYATHSEINFIPKNLFVKIPEGVDDLDASFVTVGAIALQGVRQAEPRLGEKVAVIGLGLIGQLTVQLLKANGCQVIGSDVDPEKLKLAKELGANRVCTAADLVKSALDFSEGQGVDSVIITASTPSDQPVSDAGEIARMKGRVIVVGLVGMNIPRDFYYKKELDLRLSMAYGPGRYDVEYEEAGLDYPYSYVRFTEQRNFQSFLELVAEGRVTPKKLITHTYDFADSLKAYDLLEGKTKEKYLGIVLTYPAQLKASEHKVISISNDFPKLNEINIGLIGAGNFTKSVILPVLKKIKEFNLVGLATATGVSSHSTGKKYDFKLISTDSNEVILHSGINALVVTTRHSDHAEKVLASIEAGKHVFVEKPLCIQESELEKIKSTYFSSTKKPIIQVGFNRRFAPLIQQMKSNLGDSPVAIHYRINAGVIPLNSWVQDPSVGGGRVVGEICHFIDTCSFLAGSSVESVSATCIKKQDKSIPDEDNINISLQFVNGSTATIGYYAFGNSQMAKEYIELFAKDISMQMDNFRNLIIFNGSKKNSFSSSNQDKGFYAEFEAFKNAMITGNPPISFESIYNTTLVTFRILDSLRNGRIEKV